MVNDIFISYSRRDLEFVTQLHQTFLGQDLSAWFDKESIEVADHWRTSIVEGIRDCKVFVLVLSPDSVASVNVRKEVDLAERYKKQIVPLMWRAAEIPVAMEYQLAGIQYMNFREMSSQENFNQLADVLRQLMGGTSLVEATSQKALVVAPAVPALPKAETAPPGPKKLGLKTKQMVSPMAMEGLVISRVVTTMGLDTEDQDMVNRELKWLFHAVDHLLKIRNDEIDSQQPVAVSIPTNAIITVGANNRLLDNSLAPAYAKAVTDILGRIKTHLDNLSLAQDREVQLGQAARENLGLQNEIKGSRLSIVGQLRELAPLIDSAYGVKVTVPDQLHDFLKE